MTHEIIKTKNYLLAVDDSEIKEGDYHVAIRIVKTNGDKAIAFTDQEQLDAIAEIGGAKKIIAHLPLNNSPVLEFVPLLPPLEDDNKEVWDQGLAAELEKLPYTKHLDDGQYNDGQLAGFEFGATWGYNKAKEKYKYTEEDMVIFADWYYKTQGLPENNIKYWGKNLFEVWKSLQQPKMPVGFECEVERIYPNPQTISKEYDFDDILIEPKTTTNSQGQTQWVGKYIY